MLLRPCATTREPVYRHEGSRVLQLRADAAKLKPKKKMSNKASDIIFFEYLPYTEVYTYVAFHLVLTT